MIFLPENSILIELDKSEPLACIGFDFSEEEKFLTFGKVIQTASLYESISKNSVLIPIGSKVAFFKDRYLEVPNSDYAIVEYKDVKYWVVEDERVCSL